MELKDLKTSEVYGFHAAVKEIIDLQEKGLKVFPDSCVKIGNGLYIIYYHEVQAPPKAALPEPDKDFLRSLEDNKEDKERLIEYAKGWDVEESFFDKRKGIKKLVDSFLGRYHADKNK